MRNRIKFKKVIASGARLLLFCCMAMLSNCKKLIVVAPPTTSITANNVYTTDATAAAVLTGIYQKINSLSPSTGGSIPSLTLFAGLSSDEFTLWSGSTNLSALAYYQNELAGSPINYGADYWATIYPYIFICNDAIAGLNNSTSLTPAVKQQALGEAEFMRAFFYFYLVNLYDNVALVLSNNYKINAGISQVPKEQIFQQIVSDLKGAQSLLSPNFLDATLVNTTADRVRPTQWAADALLARTYLYMGNWASADSAASILINSTSLFSLNSLGNAFLRASLGNHEAIWQLQPVTTSPSNTYDALIFTMSASGPGTAGNFGAYVSNNLLSSFEPNDQRKQNWIGNIKIGTITYYYPFKYKLTTGPVNEHLMVLRLAEQYLIRAEARAHEGNISGAQADLDSIRARAGLPSTTASSQSDLYSAILHERQVELFAEFGHRWLDLKRSGAVDSTMTVAATQKNNSVWHSYQQLYPILTSDIQLDPNLKQNVGY